MSTKAATKAPRAREGSSSQASSSSSSSMAALATRSKDTQTAALSLSMLNVGYNNRERETGGEGDRMSGRGVRDEEERPSLAPETPQRAARPNPGENIYSILV